MTKNEKELIETEGLGERQLDMINEQGKKQLKANNKQEEQLKINK